MRGRELPQLLTSSERAEDLSQKTSGNTILVDPHTFRSVPPRLLKRSKQHVINHPAGSIVTIAFGTKARMVEAVDSRRTHEIVEPIWRSHSHIGVLKNTKRTNKYSKFRQKTIRRCQ